MNKLKMKNFLLNFKLLLFSLLFAFTMGEILVRYSDKIEDLLIQFNLKLSDKVTALRIPDGYLHHTLRPNVSALSVWGTRKIIYHTNSLGYRDIKQRKISKKN